MTAYVFSFTLPRLAQLNHAQLLIHFPALLSLLFLSLYLTCQKLTHRFLYLFATGVFSVWQIWVSIYSGIFHFLMLGIVFIVLLSFKAWRSKIKSLFLTDYPIIIATGLICFFALVPMIEPYLEIKDLVGYRTWEQVRQGLTQPKLFFYAHPQSLMYADLFHFMVRSHPTNHMEPFLFPGFAILFVPLLVLATYIFFKISKLNKPRTVRRLSHLTFFSIVCWLILFLISVDISPTWLTPYRYFSEYLPAFGSIRVVSRIHLQGILFLGIAAGALITLLSTYRPKTGYVFGTLFLATIILENWLPSHGLLYSKSINRQQIDEIKNQIVESNAQSCEVFYLAKNGTFWMTHTAAMWVSQELKIPTVNGYSGHFPPNYQMGVHPWLVTIDHVKQWLVLQGLEMDKEKICLIK